MDERTGTLGSLWMSAYAMVADSTQLIALMGIVPITDRFGREPVMAAGLVIGAIASALMPHLVSAIPLAML